MNLPIISISILLPILSALYIAIFIGHSKSHNREIHTMYVTVLSTILTLITTIYMLLKFDNDKTGYQFVEKYNFIEKIGLELHFGLDGISIFFVFLSSLLTTICIIASIFTIKKYIKEFLLCFLFLESFCIAAFSSIDILLFFILFEMILFPMYLIIGIWGGENRIFAAIKFFIYSFVGSLLLLFAVIYMHEITNSFNINILQNTLPYTDINTQKILWIATFIAFAIKVPIPPLHTWLPDAHVQAPTAGSIMLAGVLLKLGGYAILRIALPMLPDATEYFAQYVIWLGVFAIIYASILAIMQKNIKKLIAYSSIAHMGYVVAGVFSLTSEGISGALFQMISHGLISATLFLAVGILYERGHTKDINAYGGIAKLMPFFAACFMIASIASVGVPGSSGFIGELMTMIGMYKANKLIAILAATSLILGAIYILNMYKSVMLGNINPEINQDKFKDLSICEILAITPLVFAIILTGIFPNIIFNITNTTTKTISDIFLS